MVENAVRTKGLKLDIPLVLFLFVLLFAPPIVPQINTALFAALYAAVMLLTKYRRELLPMFKQSGALRFCIVMAVFFVYIAVVIVLNVFVFKERVQLMHYIKLGYRFFLILPVLVVSALYVCLRGKARGMGVYDIAMCCVAATLIQFLLALLALLVPEIKTLFIRVIHACTGDSYLTIPWVMERRGFGFSNSFVDSFGFGMGIIAALPLFFVTDRRLWMIHTVPFLIFVSFVNVRTGIVIAGVGLLVAMPNLVRQFFKMRLSVKFKFAANVLAALAVLAVLIGLVFLCNPLTIRWVLGDIVDMTVTVADAAVGAVTSGNTTVSDSSSSGNADSAEPEEPTLPEIATPDSVTTTSDLLLSDRFWNLPKGWTAVFGTGHTLYGADGYGHSDVGYINDLWLGGIFGCLLLYGAFALLLIKAFINADGMGVKSLVLFLAAAIALFQVKANAIMFNAGMVVIITLLFYICSSGRNKNERI